jgi:hypothetical protein
MFVEKKKLKLRFEMGSKLELSFFLHDQTTFGTNSSSIICIAKKNLA